MSSIAERWLAFHRANPAVYVLFRRFAGEARAAGHERYSADALLHRIRWHTTVETRGDGFRLNNNWSALYARKLVADDPSYAGFFELRKRKAAKPRRKPARRAKPRPAGMTLFTAVGA